MRRQRVVVFLAISLLAGVSPSGRAESAKAQAAKKVDFAKDVMPLFRQNCLECHGPKKQEKGMRLDRKSSAMKLFSQRVLPGSSANSKVYRRLIGVGAQMPPKGALGAEQVAIVKAWIDQGADWPDSLANEGDLPPPNPKAVAMVESLRSDELPAFLKAAEADPNLLNARGPEGSTPFMYAVLYSNTATLAKLLNMGADPNKRNDANATALMWAARDLEKTRLLVGHGGDVNARSDTMRTPLMIAARRPGAAAIVEFLLDQGANPNPNAKPTTESSPLLEALTAGDASSVKLLLRRGADAKATAEQGLGLAVATKCDEGLELLAAHITDKQAYTLALQDTAVLGDLKAVRLMLDHGADVNAFDPTGRTPLMYASISDLLPLDVVQLLIERGADVNAKDKHTKSGDAGLTVLEIAKQNGKTPIVDLLVKSGAKAGPETPLALQPRPDNTIRSAVQDSLPLLQRADSYFTKNAGCFSCHNNSMEAMAVGLARKRGLRIDEQTAAAQVRFNVQALEALRDKLHQGYVFEVGDIFTDFVIGYTLVGLHAENYPADLNTDAAALLIQSRQKPNGEWPYPRADTRPPICLDYIGQTAIAMRALQVYAPKTSKAACAKSVRLAASWLAQASSSNHEDRCWRLTGLAWAGTDQAAIRKAMQEVLATQRPDGGWSDLPSTQSTAYATGKSLVALQIGGLPVSDPAYQRGIKLLLASQQKDGSWYTKTRALGFQPYFDGSFPHGYDQWMSAAGTSWAAMALTLALPETGPVTASPPP
ncbi:MAG TPA: ankyrin repeat domain-containing protein [Gemmataceae bacterium]|nr:ankyrin repeat domain-containing protein [Gemmataceae bacterium]